MRDNLWRRLPTYLGANAPMRRLAPGRALTGVLRSRPCREDDDGMALAQSKLNVNAHGGAAMSNMPITLRPGCLLPAEALR